MLSATRHKKLLLMLALLTGSAFAGYATYRIRDAVLFSRLSAQEKQVIGVWTWTTIDAVGRMRMRPSHRFDMWFVEEKSDEDHPKPRLVTHGLWRVAGAEFIYSYDPGQLGGKLQDFQPPHIPLSDFADGRMKRVRTR
jgi:hypothetical protein